MHQGTPPPSDIWPLNDYEAKLPHHDLLWVEGGTFMMGSEDEEAMDWEKPLHEVTLSSFCMARNPVTQALYVYVMEVENPSGFKGENRPVEGVSWYDAQLFVKKLNEKTGRAQSKWQYALPTEAQWEYAARGGDKKEHWKYAGSNKLKEVGWFDTNSHGETKPVGMKIPNALGLYDMSGNVLEWCEDGYSETSYQESYSKGILLDSKVTSNTSGYVFRGGSWKNHYLNCRVGIRDNHIAYFSGGYIGFRLVLVFQAAG